MYSYIYPTRILDTMSDRLKLVQNDLGCLRKKNYLTDTNNLSFY